MRARSVEDPVDRLQRLGDDLGVQHLFQIDLDHPAECRDRDIGGAAFERIISTGIENEKQAEVLEGIKSGERLVVKGFETLRNRSKVKIVK